MPHTWFPSDGVTRRLFIAAIAALLAFTTLVILPGSVPAASAVEDNGSCGVDVLFILDASGSMDSAGIDAVREGFDDFVDDLAVTAPGSNIGVVEFASWAIKPFGNSWKSVTSDGAALKSYITNTYDAWSSPDYWTNWEDAHSKANEFTDANSEKPDYVVMITDGNPTTFVNEPAGFFGANPRDDSAMYEFGTVAAEDDYASLAGKIAGSDTIIGFGAGSAFGDAGTQARLGRIVDDVTTVNPLSELAAAIAELANEFCSPTIDLDKWSATSSVSTPGTIDYDFTITNTGHTTLHNVTLNDAMLGGDISDSCVWPAGNIDGDLLEGESAECSGSYAVTQADIDAGASLENTALAEGFYLEEKVSDEDSWIVDIEKTPSMELIKDGTVVDGGDGVDAGDTITYTFSVENTGNVTLEDITIDDLVTGVTVIGGPIASLAPGAKDTTTFTGEYTITQDDIDNGSFENCADVYAGDTKYDDDCTTDRFEQEPGLELSKVGEWNDESGDGYAQPGETISYTFSVENTGNVTLYGIDIADLVGGIDVEGDPIDLAPGASDSKTFTASYVITVDDIGDGHFYNVAIACGFEDEFQEDAVALEGDVCDEDDHDEPLPRGAGALEIVKDVAQKGTPAGDAAFGNAYTLLPGETEVTWQITLTNLTDNKVFDLDLVDDFELACVAAFDAAVQEDAGVSFMDPHEVLQFTCDGPAEELDQNVAEAGGEDAWGIDLERVSDDALIFAVQRSGTIGDYVWNDVNGDGVQDADEKGIAGAKVKLTLPDSSIAETVTNANGLYLFSGLPVGTHKVELILSSIPAPAEGSNKITTANSFTVDLADGQEYLTADFGVTAELPKTGVSADEIGLIALVLLVAGGLALFATRRREEDTGQGDIAA